MFVDWNSLKFPRNSTEWLVSMQADYLREKCEMWIKSSFCFVMFLSFNGDIRLQSPRKTCHVNMFALLIAPTCESGDGHSNFLVGMCRMGFQK